MIGKKIQELRNSKGLTQRELGEKIGKSISAIQKYENGIVDVKVGLLEKIAKVLGSDLSYFADTKKEIEPIAILELIVCMEELAELQKEISKFARGKINDEAIIEEIADVIISIDTIKEIVGINNAQIQEVIETKKTRNLERRKRGAFYNG